MALIGQSRQRIFQTLDVGNFESSQVLGFKQIPPQRGIIRVVLDKQNANRSLLKRILSTLGCFPVLRILFSA